MKHYEIELRDEKGYVIGGWGKVESIQDIKDYIFNIMYYEDYAITFTYIKYLGDDLTKYFEKLKKVSNCVIFKYRTPYSNADFKAYLIEVDR